MFLKKLPQKYNLKWLLVWLISSVIHLIAMTLSLLVGSSFGAVVGGAVIVPYFTIMILNALICIIGFFGPKYWFVINELGLFASGIISILIALVDIAGWEALVVVYIQFFIFIIIGALGIIVQVVAYLKRNNPISSFTSRILWIVYGIILISATIITLFSLDFEQRVRPDEMEYGQPPITNGHPLDGQLKNIKYSGGTGEYGFIITIDSTSIISESYDFDPTTSDRKKINIATSTREIEPEEMHQLELFILYESNILYEEDDLSTNTSILDAEGAQLVIDFGDTVFKKGGYYPYDNLAFTKVSNYIKNMVSVKSSKEPSNYEKLLAMQHPDEKALLPILHSTIDQIQEQEVNALSVTPTYDNWSFNDSTAVYSIDVEIEARYESGVALVSGKLIYDLNNNVLNFNKNIFEGLTATSSKKKDLITALENLKEVD